MEIHFLSMHTKLPGDDRGLDFNPLKMDTLTNSEDHGEMQHYAAFHHCLH